MVTAVPDDKVFQLDLCIVAYQLYNQSLVFPLDPWYERWARPGADRRTNLMAALHQLDTAYWGPGRNPRRDWPTNQDLDPILTDYRRIDANRPAITFDGEAYRLFTPAPFASTIDATYVADHDWDHTPRLERVETAFGPVAAPESIGDTLYAFEGATGGVKDRPPAWSLMGVVLAKATDAAPSTKTGTGSGDEDVSGMDSGAGPAGGYDLHIAYRGSQSGWAVRAAVWGFVFESGNPDWVTDMEAIRTVADRRISTKGEVVEGLRNAVIESIGSLGAALAHIAEERQGPPKSITITGHSLGGALAIQLAAALTIGDGVDLLPKSVGGWPWPDLKLTTFGAPKALDSVAAVSFNEAVQGDRVWLDGDPITSGPFHAHVGEPTELRLDGVSGTDAHRPQEIRRALVGEAGGQWEDHPSLPLALQQAERHGHRPASLFSAPKFFVGSATAGDIGGDLNLLLAAGAVSIGDRSSYLVGLTKAAAELADRQQQLRTVFHSSTTTVTELTTLVGTIAGIQPDSTLEAHLAELLVIRETIRNDWSLGDIEGLLI